MLHDMGWRSTRKSGFGGAAASRAAAGVVINSDGLAFEGRQVRIQLGDTVASALYRHGVRVFTRSAKYHRRRGLYCMSGDCPNCFVTVDGRSRQRACMTKAQPGQVVRREGGWPSVERDLLAVLDRLHVLLPVGFYYKAMIRPRWAWAAAEPLIRRTAGVGTIDAHSRPTRREARHLHPEIAVVGAGIAGLSAALAFAEAGHEVLICDEGVISEALPPGVEGQRVDELARQAFEHHRITVLENSAATGIYEGPVLIVNAPDFLHLVHPTRVVVATGAVEEHSVFQGNDLPGVFLGRAAARLAGCHGVSPGRRIVVVGRTHETAAHVATLRAAGAEVIEVDGEIDRALGKRCITGVIVNTDAEKRTIKCDALVVSSGLVPRSSLGRQADGLRVDVIGDAAIPGLTSKDVEAHSRRLAAGQTSDPVEQLLPVAPRSGIVCLCEDVATADLEQSWFEGFRSTELLKRYTTATMGPCQGQLCHSHVRAFVASRTGSDKAQALPTTARPPARSITLEDAAAGVHGEVHLRTALHQRHLEHEAHMEVVGGWWRPLYYGSAHDEYWAVHRQVGLMDVGTLGKFLVSGRDSTAFLDRLYPTPLLNAKVGRIKYAVLLDEAGYVVDDGVACRKENGDWYLTFTSAGAAAAEATLKDWASRWGYDVHVVDLTQAWGAINVAGPLARELIERVCSDPVENLTFPYLAHRTLNVAGVACLALRIGFVGELSFELHHPANRSVELWEALLQAGGDLNARPFGVDAMRLLRLEKGHIIVGQDTDFDSTPTKLSMDWAVRADKPSFLGKRGLERAGRAGPAHKLVALSFEHKSPPEGAPVRSAGRSVGYLTSSAWSPLLERGVALGWVETQTFDSESKLESDGATGTVVVEPFYDPHGERLRA
jgi:sarcosine oxidase, subunit alpha